MSALRRSTRIAPFLFAVLSAGLVGNVFATIVDTGDVVESVGVLSIGTSANGRRDISNETVGYDATFLGNSAGVLGELRVLSSQYSNAGALVVGGAGTGSVVLDLASLVVAAPESTLVTASLVLGAQATGVGTVTQSCFGTVQVVGGAPELVIGDYGQGTVSLFSNTPFFCFGSTLTVQGSAAGTAQTFLARRVGSIGTLNLTGDVRFDGGDVMRIGLDELDQPGGIGTLNVMPLYAPTANLSPLASARLTKVGPLGVLNLKTAPDGDSGRPSSFTGDIQNFGTLGGAIGTGIAGSVVNSGTIVGLSSGVTLPVLSYHGLTINGDFSQTDVGQQIVSVTPGQFGIDVFGGLTVNGSAFNDGNVNVAFAAGMQFRVSAGDEFVVFSVPSGTATYGPNFAVNIDPSGLGAEFSAVSSVSPTGVIVRVEANTAVADLAISVTDSPDPVVHGELVTYSVTVNNFGPLTATGVIVSGVSPGCVLGTIASGASASCTLSDVASSTPTFSRTLTVSGSEADPDASNNTATAVTSVQPRADLAISISDSPDPVLQGQPVSYTIAVTNNGPSAATSVITGGTLSSCTLGTIAGGGSASCTRTITAGSPGTLTQTVSVTANETDPSTANNSATATTTVNAVADISVAVSDSPDPVPQGSNIVYIIIVTNNGPSAATGVTTGGTLPACVFGTIAPLGGFAICTRTVTTNSSGTVTQTVSVAANETDPNPANNSASASTSVLAVSDLGISLTDSPDPAFSGQAVNYTVTVTNNGPSPATGVVATGTLPSCLIGNLAAGASASCTDTVTAGSAGTLSQTMSVTGGEVDLNNFNNSANASTTVIAGADLALTMTDSPDPVKKGAKLTYRLNITNNGAVSANNVVLTDVLPADITFENTATTQGTCSQSSTTVNCSIGTLAAGASATITIVIKPKTVGTITSSATTSASEADPNSANNAASAATQVVR